MKHLVIISLALSGCVSESAVLSHRSELTVQARGLSLYEDGEAGHAGMWGTTCEFETSNGNTTGDYDYPGEQDGVVDASTTSLMTMSAIVETPGGFFVTRPYDWPEQVRIPLAGVRDATFVDGGIAVLSGFGNDDCKVSWLDLDSTKTSIVVPNEICGAPSSSIDADSATGTVIIGSPVGGAVVTDDEVLAVEGLGDLVAWDAYTETIYTAIAGSDIVSGLKLDGTVVWATQLTGFILSLDDMGPEESALVVTGNMDGTGDVIILDGHSGAEVTLVPIPSAVLAIDVSDSGTVLGLALPDTVHFYDINTLN